MAQARINWTVGRDNHQDAKRLILSILCIKHHFLYK
jgi:hypothetical protein